MKQILVGHNVASLAQWQNNFITHLNLGYHRLEWDKLERVERRNILVGLLVSDTKKRECLSRRM